MNSFTMEATFCGSTMGDRRATQFCEGGDRGRIASDCAHFSFPEDFEELGKIFFDALLDYCDPDTAKVWGSGKQCFLHSTPLSLQSELLLARLRAEMVRKAQAQLGVAVSLKEAVAQADAGGGDDNSDGSDRCGEGSGGRA